MSDQAAPAGTAAPASVHTLRIEGTSGSNGSDFQRMAPEQFNARLLEAEEAGARRLLKQFGIKKEERAAILADIQAGRFVLAPKPAEGAPDLKAEYEKLRPIAEEHKSFKKKLEKHAEFFKTLADAEFAKLPESAQKYIAARAGEDPEQRLAEMRALQESGLLKVETPVATAEVRPAATTGATGGPAPVTAAGQKTAFQRFEELNGVDRLLGNAFYQANKAAVEASRPKK